MRGIQPRGHGLLLRKDWGQRAAGGLGAQQREADAEADYGVDSEADPEADSGADFEANSEADFEADFWAGFRGKFWGGLKSNLSFQLRFYKAPGYPIPSSVPFNGQYFGPRKTKFMT